MGPVWEAVRLARLDEAVTEWSTDTDYDPGRDTNSPNGIFVDGRLPTPCDVNSWGTYLVVTCYTYQNRTGTDEDYVDGPYRRMIDADIYMNMEVAASPDWWIGSLPLQGHPHPRARAHGLSERPVCVVRRSPQRDGLVHDVRNVQRQRRQLLVPDSPCRRQGGRQPCLPLSLP